LHPALKRIADRFGPRQKSAAQQYAGHLLLGLAMRRISNDEKQGARLAIYLALQHPLLLLAIFLTSTGAAVFDGGTMGIIAIAVSSVTGGETADLSGFGVVGEWAQGLRDSIGAASFFVVLVVAAITAQLLRSLMQFSGFWCTAKLRKQLSYEMQMRLARDLMRMKYASVIRYPGGKLSSYVRSASKSAELVLAFNRLLSAFLTVLVYVIVLFWLSWKMTLAALLVVSLLSLALFMIITRVHHYSEEARKESLELDKHQFEIMQSPRLLRIFGREDYAIARIREYLSSGLEYMRRAGVWRLSMEPLLDSAGIVFGGVFLLVSFVLAGQDYMTVLPIVLSFLIVLNRMIGQVKMLNKARGSVITLLPYMGQTHKIFKDAERNRSKRGGDPVEAVREGIRFVEVSFRYAKAAEPAVSDVNLWIPKGGTVGIVGPSGSGKTTIVDLIMGLQSPTSGRIEVDGRDLTCLDSRSWRQLLAMVDQDMMLLNDSVDENVRFGSEHIDSDAVRRALEVAHCTEFVRGFPEGIDTVISDRGINLSGGQRQRLALARAVASQPEVLILDEATSALDSVSEGFIQDSLRKLKGECTMIMVAHRLSTVSDADQIFVMEGGKVRERGTHSELLAMGGLYRTMWDMQSRTGESRREAAVLS